MSPQRRAKAKAPGCHQQPIHPLATSQHVCRGRRARQNVPSLQSPTTENTVPVTNAIPESLVNDIVQRVVEKLSTNLQVVKKCPSRGESSAENATSATALLDSVSAMQPIFSGEKCCLRLQASPLMRGFPVRLKQKIRIMNM